MGISAATSTYLQTANKQIAAMPGKLHSLTLIGGSAAATVTLYDSATGQAVNELEKLTCAAGATLPVDWSSPLVFNNGLYAVISGTGAGFIARYELG